MKLIVCGSGASEGLPALFCQCPVCRESRHAGGRNIRTRTSYMLGNSIKIDFGPDALMQMHHLGLDYSQLKHLFITHSHADHFYFEDLWARLVTCETILPKLKIYGNQAVLDKLAAFKGFDAQAAGVETVLLKSGETIQLAEEGLSVTPLATNHISSEESMLFLFEHAQWRLLIGNDSDTFPENVMTHLSGKLLDHLFIDCTWGLQNCENRGHMSFPANLELIARLEKQNTLDSSSMIWPIHFAHGNSDTHDRMVEQMAHYANINPAFDGLEIELNSHGKKKS